MSAKVSSKATKAEPEEMAMIEPSVDEAVIEVIEKVKNKVKTLLPTNLESTKNEKNEVSEM